jgi:hypothetical protein
MSGYFAPFSTAELTRLLDSTPGNSATHRAVEEELRAREVAHKPDKETKLLFTGEAWEATAKRWGTRR